MDETDWNLKDFDEEEEFFEEDDTETYATLNEEFVQIVDEYVRSDDLTRMCAIKYVSTGRRFDVEKSRLVFKN